MGFAAEDTIRAVDDLEASPSRTIPRGRLQEWLACCALVLAAVLPFFEALFLERSILSFDTRAFPPFSLHAPADLASRPGNFVTSDLNGWIVPEAALTLAELRAGRIPSWNPYSLCGQPLLANLAFPPFYPPNAVAIALGADSLLRSFAWLVVGHLALAGILAFWFLRGHDVAILPALVGGIGVELATWMTTRVHLPSIVATASWFFAILLAIDLVFRAPRWRTVVPLALAVGMAALAGFPQLLAVELLGAAIYASFRLAASARGDRIVAFSRIGGGVALGLVVGAVHLTPAIDQLDDSLRRGFLVAERQAENGLKPAAFLGFVLPEFFAPAAGTHGARSVRETDYAQTRWLGVDSHENPVENALSPGATLLVLMLCCGVAMRRRSTPALAALLGVGLLLGVASPWLPALHAAVPGLATSSPRRVLALFTLALPVLVAVGLDETLRRDGGPRRASRLALAIAAIAAVAALYLGAGSASDETTRGFLDRIATGSWILASCAAVVAISMFAATRGRMVIAGSALALCAAVELGARARAFNPTQDLAGQYPVTPAIEFLTASGARSARFENVEGAAASLAPYFRYRCFDGAQPMVTTRFGEFVEAIEPNRFDRDDPRVMFPFAKIESFSHPAFLRAATEFIVVTRPVPELGLEVAYGNEAEGIGVYRQPRALPRVRLVGGYDLVVARDERLRRLADPALDPRTTILLEQDPGGGIPRTAALAVGEARIVAETATELTIELTGVVAPTLLYVADTFADGWTAEVDGIATEVLAADHAFRAVAIPAGAARVVMRYRPASILIGGGASLLGLALVAVLLLRARQT